MQRTLYIFLLISYTELAVFSYSSGKTSIINIDSANHSLLDRKFIFEKENVKNFQKENIGYRKNVNLDLLKSSSEKEISKELKAPKPLKTSPVKAEIGESKRNWSQFYREAESRDLNVNARLLP